VFRWKETHIGAHARVNTNKRTQTPSAHKRAHARRYTRTHTQMHTNAHTQTHTYTRALCIQSDLSTPCVCVRARMCAPNYVPYHTFDEAEFCVYVHMCLSHMCVYACMYDCMLVCVRVFVFVDIRWRVRLSLAFWCSRRRTLARRFSKRFGCARESCWICSRIQMNL